MFITKRHTIWQKIFICLASHEYELEWCSILHPGGLIWWSLRVPLTLTKVLSRTPDKRPRTKIPPPLNFTLGTVQWYRFHGNCQIQSHPSDCQIEKHYWWWAFLSFRVWSQRRRSAPWWSPDHRELSSEAVQTLNASFLREAQRPSHFSSCNKLICLNSWAHSSTCNWSRRNYSNLQRPP